jgi:hypothetical protein
MKLHLFEISVVLLATSLICIAQINYPFQDQPGKHDILAYWFNVPADSATRNIDGYTHRFHSLLRIYGPIPTETFQVKAQVFLKSGDKIFDRIFDIRKNQPNQSLAVDFNQNSFAVTVPVDYSHQLPDRISVTIKSPIGEQFQEIPCVYHRLHGTITDFDGNPLRAFVAVGIDGFASPVGVWSDQSGNYQIMLPERTYNSIAVDDENYALETLEAWAWHIIMDSPQRLDFKIGSGEIYNLYVWPNNGGFNTYLISFRPMVLFPPGVDQKRYRTKMGGRDFDVTDVAPDLKPDDLTVTVNGKSAEIISLRKYYETGPDAAVLAYLIQVDRQGLDTIGKQTVVVEFRTQMDIGGNLMYRTAMGIFQFHLGFGGLSTYY